MEKQVPSSEQLVIELYVQNIEKPKQFYQQIGFQLIRSEPDFAVLGWEESTLFLEQIEGQPIPPSTVVANIRIMVPNMDDYWTLVHQLGLEIIRSISDREYGLRDFTVRSPDGIGLRFATRM